MKTNEGRIFEEALFGSRAVSSVRTVERLLISSSASEDYSHFIPEAEHRVCAICHAKIPLLIKPLTKLSKTGLFEQLQLMNCILSNIFT